MTAVEESQLAEELRYHVDKLKGLLKLARAQDIVVKLRTSDDYLSIGSDGELYVSIEKTIKL